ncbi:hypothetical protein [Erwinia mallotivora]|uniref:hypothetical protein n=1 Tax=Erwinia mallotivora TaxID=69222 RepID=UPI001362F5A9|nr:hypothetical protein [Erwinia mallotivora]
MTLTKILAGRYRPASLLAVMLTALAVIRSAYRQGASAGSRSRVYRLSAEERSEAVGAR